MAGQRWETNVELKLALEQSAAAHDYTSDLLTAYEDHFRDFMTIKKQQMYMMQDELVRLRRLKDKQRNAMDEARSALADAVCPLTPSEYDEPSEYDQRHEP
jgi:hypothetical protein